LSEYGACFCGLYVSDTIASKNLPAPAVPERRPPVSERMKQSSSSAQARGLTFPVYRCKVCGYLCARNNPPEKCPICKAGKERFEIFLQ
ncbi:rubredoxin-like domain-containing protein, partial [Methanospirillum hungatei]|nr:ferredoxin:glutaredoxin reductase [Methanospirillum hungatei]